MKIEVGSQEWLADRRKCVTATDAAAVMGLHPTITPLMKYHQKIDGSEIPKTFAMQRGIDLEPQARVAFEIMTGHFVIADYRKHPVFDWMAASYDGINEQGVIVEIKCPIGADHDLALFGQVPQKYIPQLQHQMFVAEVGQCFYFSYNPEVSREAALIKVDADPKFQQRMLQAEADFYKCLQSRTPPEPSERDCLLREDTSWLFKEELLCGLMLQRLRLEDQVEEIEEMEKALKAEMILMADGHMTRGYRLKFNPVKYKGAIDYGKIPELSGVDMEQYRKPETIRWRVDAI